jgi:hypothetical protein
MHRTFLVPGAAAFLGVVFGIAVAFLGFRTLGGPDERTQVLAKVARDFVAQHRIPGRGITFFDQPKPYGDWLCRVNSFYVPEKVLTGKLVLQKDWWDDDLSETRLFGIWRRPTQGPGTDAARHKACAAFRDFDHAFTVQGSGDPDRGVFLLDNVISQLHSGKLTIPLSCTDTDQRGRPATCDAERVLRPDALHELRQVEAVSEQEIDHGMRRTDRLTLSAAPDSLTFVVLTVVSEQRFGKQSASEGDVKSVKVEIERFK